MLLGSPPTGVRPGKPQEADTNALLIAVEQPAVLAGVLRPGGLGMPSPVEQGHNRLGQLGERIVRTSVGGGQLEAVRSISNSCVNPTGPKKLTGKAEHGPPIVAPARVPRREPPDQGG